MRWIKETFLFVTANVKVVFLKYNTFKLTFHTINKAFETHLEFKFNFICKILYLLNLFYSIVSS